MIHTATDYGSFSLPDVDASGADTLVLFLLCLLTVVPALGIGLGLAIEWKSRGLGWRTTSVALGVIGALALTGAAIFLVQSNDQERTSQSAKTAAVQSWLADGYDIEVSEKDASQLFRRASFSDELRPVKVERDGEFFTIRLESVANDKYIVTVVDKEDSRRLKPVH